MNTAAVCGPGLRWSANVERQAADQSRPAQSSEYAELSPTVEGLETKHDRHTESGTGHQRGAERNF